MIKIYKVIGRNVIFGDILQQTLENRGIRDIERFLAPSKLDEIPYQQLKSIDKAVTMFEKHRGSTSEFTILVDSDAD